jgi:NAD(P)-dependent dehydrogenase (short-subunit alcohol dehydrogenase family)
VPSTREPWLRGRVAVVTGASRGIGRATAEAVAREGAHVVLAARDAGSLEAAVGAIREDGGLATSVPTDVSDEDQVERLFGVARELGPPAALVCAAAVLTRADFDQTSTETWSRTLEVNLTGTFLCCRAAFRLMRDSTGGRIVTIASLSGVYAVEKFPGLAAYNVSKSGVVGLTESVAVEGRAHGISAICLSPGAVETELLHQANPDLRARLGPDDVAEVIVGLLDDRAVALSGANIPLFSNA